MNSFHSKKRKILTLLAVLRMVSFKIYKFTADFGNYL